MAFSCSRLYDLLFILLVAINFVQANLYVIAPKAGSTCQGGQACTVSWLDDGEEPLLSSIGACTVGLYTGNDELLQQIEPVNVASTHSFQFTPNPIAGPDADTYFIRFTSLNLMEPNSTNPYVEYSPDFSLGGMSGSTDTVVPSLTSTLSIPSTVANPPANSVISTSTIGSISLPTLSSSSGAPPSSRSLVTSARSSSAGSTSKPSTSPSSSSTPKTNAALRTPSSSPVTDFIIYASAILLCSSLHII